MDGDLSPRHVLLWTNLQLQQLPHIHLTKCSPYSSNINKVYKSTVEEVIVSRTNVKILQLQDMIYNIFVFRKVVKVYWIATVFVAAQ